MSIAKVVSGVLALGLYVAASVTWAAEGPHTYSADDVAAGKAVYTGTCIACHGANGKGLLPGTPDFTKPGGVLSLSDKVLEDRIIHGFSTGDASMPPDGGNASLKESDIKHVIAYLHATFGH